MFATKGVVKSSGDKVLIESLLTIVFSKTTQRLVRKRFLENTFRKTRLVLFSKQSGLFPGQICSRCLPHLVILH